MMQAMLRSRVGSPWRLILVALVCAPAVVLSAAGAPAKAASPSALPTAMSARAGDLIEMPAANAALTHPVVRIQVRALAGAKTTIQLGRTNVTNRFRRASGRLVADLRIRPGVNRLFVPAERKGRSAVSNSHTFYFVRRNNRFVAVRVRRTRPYTAQVDVANLTTATLARRLAAVRRQRTVRIWLNGRRVDRAASAPQRTRYTLEFSASQGLRFGVNRLAVRVVEPGAARYAVVERRFVVPATDRSRGPAGTPPPGRIAGCSFAAAPARPTAGS